MPSADVHRDITRSVLLILSSNDIVSERGFSHLKPQLWDLLVEHVVDPDNEPDGVKELVEYCVYEGKEISLDECESIREKIRQLRSEYTSCVSNYGQSDYRCLSLNEELTNLKKSLEIKKEAKIKFAKHHGGLNRLMYNYYFYNAVRCFMLGKEDDAMTHLGRALHYVQDAPLRRRITISGKFGVAESSEDYHDVIEDSLNEIWWHYKNSIINDLTNLLKKGQVSGNIEKFTQPTDDPIMILENAMLATYITLRRFDSVINKLLRSKSKVIQEHKVVNYGTYALIAAVMITILMLLRFPTSIIMNAIIAELISLSILIALKDVRSLTYYMLGITRREPRGLIREVKHVNGKRVTMEVWKHVPTCNPET